MTTRAPFRWPKGKQAALSLTFDDARPSQLDHGVPVLDTYHVHATFYVSLIPMRRRAADWRRAAASGHEIGNHSVTHPCSGNFWWSHQAALEDYSLARIRAELTEADEVIRVETGVNPVTFAYPCGQKFVGRGTETKSYVPLIADHFLAGRGFRDESGNDPVRCDLAQLCGMDADGTAFEILRLLIDEVRERGQWLVLVAHEIGDSQKPQTLPPATLDQLCCYASDPNNEIWIDTVAAIGQYVRDHRVPSTPGPERMTEPFAPLDR